MRKFKAVEEIHTIIEKIYEEEKKMTLEQRVKMLHEESNKFLLERKLNLRRVKNPVLKVRCS